MGSEARYLEIVSGRDRSLPAVAARLALTPAAWVYGLLLKTRNAWYSAVPFASRKAGAPVISVGNITTGGTGKTPVAAWIAQHLVEGGHRPAILLRGYKGKPVKFDAASPQAAQSQWRVESDEAELLKRLCPRASVVIEPNRLAGASAAIASGCDVLLLDDGFQHRRLRRDLDIVLIDATCPFGHGHMLPRGLLREPMSGLRRAGLIIVTRWDQADAARRDDILRRLSNAAPGKPILRARHAVSGLCDLSGRPIRDADCSAMTAVIFAGVANFAAFRRTVEDLGITVRAAFEFPDHHDYTDADLVRLPHAAIDLEANALLTTEKDAVKLVGRWPDAGLPLFVPRITIAFEAGDAQILQRELDRITPPGSARK